MLDFSRDFSLCLEYEILSLNSAWKWLKWCWTCWKIKEWQQGVPKRPIILWRTYLWHVWDCKTFSFYIVWTKHTLTWAAFCKNYATCWAYIMFTNGRRSETFYFWQCLKHMDLSFKSSWKVLEFYLWETVWNMLTFWTSQLNYFVYKCRIAAIGWNQRVL